MKTANRIKIGDKVKVIPDNVLAVGKGIGRVTAVGDVIVRVAFEWCPNREVACFKKDCLILEAK